MNIKEALQPIKSEHLRSLSRKELVDLLLGEQDIRLQLLDALSTAQEELIDLGERYLKIKLKAFTPSSERSPRKNPNFDKPVSSSAPTGSGSKSKANPEASSTDAQSSENNRKLLPSDRYPNADVIEFDVELTPLPQCQSCQKEMTDSGMTESCEILTVIPRKFQITRQNLHKYCCRNCRGSIVTSPTPPRIKKGSSYSDEMIIDVALSKYCDLIPIERYKSMAERSGFPRLPANSLIELTHYLADFLDIVFHLIRNKTLTARVLSADETPHRMFETAGRSSWYLWGFSSISACFYECHNTRSGDVATQVLKMSQCEILVSDVFAGYNKAVRKENGRRKSEGLATISNAFCNAHARRKFVELTTPQGDQIVEIYKTIYALENGHLGQELAHSQRRELMRPHFEKIKALSLEIIDSYSSKSASLKSANYFVKNYEGLTRFIADLEIPIDNNRQERGLRNPVIGRKTWYGTHSRRGAKTAVILTTIVESCKLVNVNPRSYVQDCVRRLHSQLNPILPSEFAELSDEPA